MSKAFRYSVPEGTTIADLQISDDLRRVVRECRTVGTHGRIARIDFVDSHDMGVRAVVTFNDGSIKKMAADACRLHNLLVCDLAEEPTRRVAFRAAHPLASPNGDPRFRSDRPLDEDAAHHRRFN